VQQRGQPRPELREAARRATRRLRTCAGTSSSSSTRIRPSPTSYTGAPFPLLQEGKQLDDPGPLATLRNKFPENLGARERRLAWGTRWAMATPADSTAHSLALG
jgi:hypothetical protein